ncbi:MAG: 16S rRNA processing protein RimM [Clostridia bacterium]|jgi:16S rRNA processing protein RimM|nr:16S rRNA processing protein RimM [Clostridia bacterium]
MKQFLETGRITGTHGLKGEVRVQPWADSPEFLAEFDELYLDKGARKIEISSSRVHKSMLIMKIKGIDSIEQADGLRNKILYMNRDDVELDDDTYFIQDLIGLDVIDDDTGEKLGVLDDVSETGSNDVYHIKTGDGKIFLIPAIPDVIREVSLEGGIVRVFKMKGLFE